MGEPTVAIIVPVIETESRKYWDEFAKSVDSQTFDASKILVVHVVRYESEMPGEPLYEKASLHTIRVKRDASEPISDMEQYGIGMEYVIRERPSVKHIVCSPANDLLAPDFIKKLRLALTADDRAMVSVPDFENCTQNTETVSFARMNDNLNLPDMVTANYIPDPSMFSRAVYEAIPFDSSHRRASFWIWWIKIFMRFGPFAFTYVHEPIFRYRQHRGQSSGDDAYVLQGTEDFTAWAHSEGLLPKNMVIRPTGKMNEPSEAVNV